jgi:hypothetical protein
MSDFDSQFNDVALPLLAERLGDSLTLWVSGSPALAVPFIGIVEIGVGGNANTTVTHTGRDESLTGQIQVTTSGISPKSTDKIVMPDGTIANVIRQISTDPDGNYPLLEIKLPRGITSKQSRTRT